MNQVTEHATQFRSFNMDPPAGDKMYHTTPQEDLTLTLFIDTRQEHCTECNEPLGIGGLFDYWVEPDPEAVLTELVKSCIANSALPDMKCEVLLWTEEENVEYEIVQALPLSPPQKKWLFDNMVHSQVGFHSHVPCEGIFHPELSMYTAMSVYDALYVFTKSLDPKDHHALDLNVWQEKVLHLAVADFYRLKICNWCESLASLRNEVLVKVRAKLYSMDPDKEWKKFKDAGLIHYLDHLSLP